MQPMTKQKILQGALALNGEGKKKELQIKQFGKEVEPALMEE